MTITDSSNSEAALSAPIVMSENSPSTTSSPPSRLTSEQKHPAPLHNPRTNITESEEQLSNVSNKSSEVGNDNRSTESAQTPTSLTTALPSPVSGSGTANGVTGPSVINKQLLSKLNKSLKEKQKTVSTRDIQTRNPTLIQDVLSTSPTAPSNSSNGTFSPMESNKPVGTGAGDDLSKDVTNDNDPIPVTSSHTQNKEPSTKQKAKPKTKKVSKQSSTKTDFFAAKLASAVDDVESSDSDETFVYESNVLADRSKNNAEGSTNSQINPSSCQPEDARGAGNSSVVENLSRAPPSIQLVNDNISVAESSRNPLDSNAESPLNEIHREDESTTNNHIHSTVVSRAESIHSLQSSKYNLRNTFNTTPPTTTNSKGGMQNYAPNTDIQSFSDPYLETNIRFPRHPIRKNSSYSVLSDDRRDNQNRVPPSPFVNHKNSSAPYSSPLELPDMENTLNERFNDGLYHYGEGDVSSADEKSSHGDFQSVGTDSIANNTIIAHDSKNFDNSVTNFKKAGTKTSTTSSKLRSTTSKLFDKKGAQPRRYSTIPDDIDIEDFDDELIYYDNNNMRFPYNSQNPSIINESSSLLNGKVLPHRSLSTNYNGRKVFPSSRKPRYVSLGYTSPTYGGNKKNEVFPFPYSVSHHSPYYGFDEYDEDLRDHERDGDRSNFLSTKGQISPKNARFVLPNKVSQDSLSGNNFKFFKRLVYSLIGIFSILSIGFISGFILASTKDLSNVSIVSIDHATVSQDELIFNVVVEALNPGWFTVSVQDVELDVFAKSGYLDDKLDGLSVETVLLGSVLNFESVLYFEGSFFNRQATQQIGEIKLVTPGKNLTGSSVQQLLMPRTSLQNSTNPDKPHAPPENSEKWAVISRHPFDLILRGVLKYNLPWTNNVKSVVVNKVGYIDPSLSS